MDNTSLPHDDKRELILVSIWLLTGLSLLFLVLRLFCKFKTRRGLWWDDHVMVLSWVRGCLLPPRTICLFSIFR